MVIFFTISIFLNIVLLFLILSRKKESGEKAASTVEKEIAKQESSYASSGNTDNTGDSHQISQFQSWLQSVPDKSMIADLFLQKVASDIQAVQGALYVHTQSANKNVYRFKNGYAFSCPESNPIEFETGESLIGQVAKDKKILNLSEKPIPHTQIISGLGMTTSQYLIVCPLVKNDQTVAVVEFSSFKPVDRQTEQFISDAAAMVAETTQWQ